MRRTESLKFAAAALIVSILTGCSGGGNGRSSGTGGGETPQAIETYLFYSDGLNAVSAQAPASSIAIESSTVTAARTVLDASYDASARSLDHIRSYAIVYAAGGRLWRVAASTAEPPTPLQVSSETQATQLCWADTWSDLVDRERSAYLYELPGADGLCGTAADNAWRMVRLNTAAVTAPMSVPKPLGGVTDPATGALAGWLTAAAGTLEFYDGDFTHSTALGAFASTAALLGGVNGQVVRLDDGIYVFDPVMRTLSAKLLTLAAFKTWIHDGDAAYLVDGETIYEVTLSGAPQTRTIATDAQLPAENILLAASDGAVIYGWTSGDSTVLKTVSKAGGTPAGLYAGAGTVVGPFAAGSWVYFTLRTPTGVPTAWAMRDDGSSAVTHANAAWQGVVFDTTQPADTGAPIRYMLLVDGYDMLAGSGNAQVVAYNATTHTAGALLGTIPERFSYVSFRGRAPALLGTALQTTFDGETITWQTDVLYLDVTQDDSLVQVTSTADRSEAPW